MRPRIEQPTLKLILRDLEDGPASVKDLEETLKIDRRNLRPYLTLLHEQQHIHICAWEQRTGPALPVYSAGSAADRKRPARKHKRRGLIQLKEAMNSKFEEYETVMKDKGEMTSKEISIALFRELNIDRCQNNVNVVLRRKLLPAGVVKLVRKASIYGRSQLTHYYQWVGA